MGASQLRDQPRRGDHRTRRPVGVRQLAADHVVFELLRAISDVVVVGAGTLRSEGYTALSVANRWQTTRSGLGLADGLPLVCVSNSGAVPPRLRDAPRGTVLMATHTGSPGLAEARDLLGDE